MSGAVRIDRRLYLTEDKSRAVEEGHPEAATLLCPAGGEVPHATAARYGLLEKTNPEPEPDSEEKAPEPRDEKAEPEKKTPAAANKARGRSADKAKAAEEDK
jgi:hypothetical protein